MMDRKSACTSAARTSSGNTTAFNRTFSNSIQYASPVFSGFRFKTMLVIGETVVTTFSGRPATGFPLRHVVMAFSLAESSAMVWLRLSVGWLTESEEETLFALVQPVREMTAQNADARRALRMRRG